MGCVSLKIYLTDCQGSAKTKRALYNGDAFIVDNADARYALSVDEHVGEI